ncbi:hypothetical protein JCM4814A_24100 [Streptomyces phaeofaciens JCM 4814]|uniref:Uncharacterized protein n=1 Tax=Streptomyces phaeofaciens TaxID=68254 RepID=A0A918H3U4_9ACTN|nr:hypothetical protein [Streptomyces phaeofaciens]GGT35463.1 hypothetical protein GCM10010226_09430 [Streptomyces phaeofaciens]
MSSPDDHENGTNAAAGEPGAVPRVRPAVYHPYAEADPSSYTHYSDPAAAHGWQNAYDETTELPRVAPAPADRPAPPGRADRRRAARRTDGRLTRRVVAAAGAVGVVSLAALVAGLSFTSGSPGSPAGERRGEPGDTLTAPDGTADPESGSPSASVPAGSPDVRTSAPPGASAEPSSAATPSEASGAGSSAASSAGATDGPAASATTSAPGSGKGNGRGRTKGPR